MNLDRMILAAIVVAALGVIAGNRSGRDRTAIFAIGGLAIFAFLHGGMYWNVFGRGVGPTYFTYNRLSAAAVFAALLVGPSGARSSRNA